MSWYGSRRTKKGRQNCAVLSRVHTRKYYGYMILTFRRAQVVRAILLTASGDPLNRYMIHNNLPLNNFLLSKVLLIMACMVSDSFLGFYGIFEKCNNNLFLLGNKTWSNEYTEMYCEFSIKYVSRDVVGQISIVSSTFVRSRQFFSFNLYPFRCKTALSIR